MSSEHFDPNAPETEEDGYRAGALRMAKYRHQAKQMRERNQIEAIANAERDAPIRARFHDWMERSGFRPMPIPEPGRSYSGSHIEALWEAYLDATLNERAAK